MQFHSLVISLFSKDLYSTSLRLLLRGAPESSKHSKNNTSSRMRHNGKWESTTSPMGVFSIHLEGTVRREIAGKGARITLIMMITTRL